MRKILCYESAYHDAMYNTELRNCAEVNTFTSQLKRVFKISFFGIEMKVFEC